MNPPKGDCKTLMGYTGNVFVKHESTQVFPLTPCVISVIKLRGGCKKTVQSCFKTKAFIAKNALDMKKQSKSATGHQYKTMYNDHMVESAGHGQCRAWLQWHKRPINILHNIELYIYFFFFLFLSLYRCIQPDSVRMRRLGRTRLFHKVPFLYVKSYIQRPPPLIHTHTHTHSIHRNKYGRHLIQDGRVLRLPGRTNREWTLIWYRVQWESGCATVCFMLCSCPMEISSAAGGFLAAFMLSPELPSGIYNQEAETKHDLTSRGQNKTRTAWKHWFKISDVKWPPCSGFIPDVVNPPPPRSINLMHKRATADIYWSQTRMRTCA